MSETAASGSGSPVQDLRLDVVVGDQVRGNGLKQLRRELEGIDTYLHKIQSRFTEVGRKAFPTTGVDGFKAKLEAAFKAAGNTVNLNVREMAKQLGLLQPKFEGIFGRYRRNNPGDFRTKDTAASPQKMAEFFSHLEQRYQRREHAVGELSNRAFRNALYGGRPGPAVNPKVSEVREVAMNHDRLIAALERLTVAVETRGVAGSTGQGAGSGAAGSTGQGAGSGGLGAGREDDDDRSPSERRSKKLGTGATIKGLPAEAQRRVTSARGSRYSTVVRQILADNELVETTFDRKGSAKKVVTTTDLAKKAREDFLDKWQGEMGELAKALPKQRRGRSANDLLQLAGAYEKSATQLSAELGAVKGDDRKLLGRSFVRKVNKAITDLRAEAEVVLGLAAQAESAKPSLQNQRRQTLDVLRAVRAAENQDRTTLRTDDKNQAAKNRARARVQDAVAAAADARAEAAAGAARTAQLNFTQKQANALMQDLQKSGYTRGAAKTDTKFGAGGNEERRVFAFSKDEGGRRLTQQFTEIYKNGRLATVQVQTLGKELKALTGGVDSGKGFLENTAHVTRWAASVGALYGSLALARSGLKAFLDLSYEVARLDQVYRKQGGTTQALADDVLRLAAANGRSSQEALQAATSWARLGLTRQQINQAVETSLIAANVAELDTLEATKFLQSTMAAYGLQIRQVTAFMSGLNDISNKLNVTNADLLEGISKTANVAKQAGIPLSELSGLIGATVANTGQSGANIGNAIKSIIVALSNPVLQKTLKSEFGLEMVSPQTGDLKNFSAVLSELYLRYQELNNAERQSLLFQTAGKTQASKLAGMLDAYIVGMVRASNQLLNLNSAQEENEKITGTLKNELTGLVTEFERFALQMGSSGPAKGIALAAQSLKNMLTVLQLPGVGLALTGIITLLGALTVRLVLTKHAMTEAGAKVGWFDKSLREVGTRAQSVWKGVGTVIHGVAREMEGAGGMLGRFGTRVRGLDQSLRLLARNGRGTFKQGVADYGEAFAPPGANGFRGGRRLGLVAAGGYQMAVGGAAAAAGVGGRLALGGIAAVGTMIPQILAGMLAVGAATWGVDKAMGALGLNTSRVDGLMDDFTKEMNRAEAAAEAAGIQVRFLDTAVKALGNGKLRGGERNNILRALADLEKIGGKPGEKLFGPEKLAELGRLGDATLGPTAAKLFEAERKGIIDQQVRERQNAFLAAQQVMNKLPGEIGNLRDPKERAAKEAEYRQAQMTKLNLQAQLVEGDPADAAAMEDRKKVTQLERQKVILEGIRDLYKDMATVDPTTRYYAEADAAQAALRYAEGELDLRRKEAAKFDALGADADRQAAAKRAQAADLRKYMNPQAASALEVNTRLGRAAQLEDEATMLESTRLPEGVSVADQQEAAARRSAAQQLLEEATRKAAEAGDPRKRILAEQLTAYEDAKRDRKTANEAFGIGDSEGERLADRRLRLEQERQRIARESANDLKSLAELEQTIVDLIETENRLRERGPAIERELAQAKRESNREFNRAFLEGDATSRLKQLAAVQAGKMGMLNTAGGYMALGDLQRYLPDADKPFGKTAELRQEQEDTRRGLGDSSSPTTRRYMLNDARLRYLNGGGRELAGELNEVGGTTEVALRAVEKAATLAATALQAAAVAAGKFAERGGVQVERRTTASNPQSGGN